MMKYVFQIAAVLAFGGMSFAQVTDLGGPISWSNDVVLNAPAKQHTMAGFDLAEIRAEDEVNDLAKDQPWRFGYSYKSSIDLNETGGDWTTFSNGDRVWKAEIVCPEALSVNLIFENLYIPDGASIYLYDKANTNRVGAYTSRNNREDGILGTELVLGDHIIVEYFEPAAVFGLGHFKIANVIHGYRSVDYIQDELEKALNSSADCHYDVECPLGDGWEDQIRSVAMIVVNGNGICTGALINNTCEDGRPLFLSANHCLSGGVSSWAFRFNWKADPGTEVCADTNANIDPGPPYDETANGATILASGTESDHLLLELDNLTLTDVTAWNLYYAGWNHDDNAIISNSVVIHHPLGDLMKISQEEDTVYHSVIAQSEVWWVDSYEFGSTQGGSSGAPLFSQNGRIVGQLYGGQAGCTGTSNNGLYDYYGRLGVSWNHGVAEHLAPAACGQALILDGWEPGQATQNDDASAQAVSTPLGDVCGATFTPEVSIRNAGDNDLTSCTLTYNIDGGTNMVYNWTGTLAPNDSETITLPTLTSTGGAHIFNAFTSDPNATVDTDQTNDTVSVGFTIFENTIATYVNIETDCYGHETAWEIYDPSVTLMASGGNQTVPPGGNQTASSSDPGSYGNLTTIREKLCLAVGCYDFIIYDDWGDGLEGSSQVNCSTDGNYTVTNSSSTVLGSMQNVAFGISETINFCVVNDASVPVLNLDDFHLYPNPSDGMVHISIDGAKSNDFNLTVRDLSGRVIYSSLLTSSFNTIDLSSVANGNYFFTIDNGSMRLTKKLVVNN